MTVGAQNSRVASEWYSRPEDERYLTLDKLYDSVICRAERSRTRIVASSQIRIEASSDTEDKLTITVPGNNRPLTPTHWSFGQLCSLVNAPAGYLRDMPASLASISLQYGLSHHRTEQVKLLELDDGQQELRAATGLEYGRIFDQELVRAVQQIAGNGIGDTR